MFGLPLQYSLQVAVKKKIVGIAVLILLRIDRSEPRILKY